MHLYTKSWASQQPEIDPGGSPQDRGLKQLESRKNSFSLCLYQKPRYRENYYRENYYQICFTYCVSCEL